MFSGKRVILDLWYPSFEWGFIENEEKWCAFVLLEGGSTAFEDYDNLYLFAVGRFACSYLYYFDSDNSMKLVSTQEDGSRYIGAGVSQTLSNLDNHLDFAFFLNTKFPCRNGFYFTVDSHISALIPKSKLPVITVSIFKPDESKLVTFKTLFFPTISVLKMNHGNFLIALYWRYFPINFTFGDNPNYSGIDNDVLKFFYNDGNVRTSCLFAYNESTKKIEVLDVTNCRDLRAIKKIKDNTIVIE